jgi:TolB-like protein
MDLARRSLAVAVAASVCLSTSGIGEVAAAAPRPALVVAAPSEGGGQQQGGGKLAILPLVIEGSLSEADQATLTQALISGLQRGNFTVLTPEQVIAADSGAAKCDNAVCYKSIATKTGAAYIVRAVVTVRDRDYNVQVDLLTGADGQRIAASKDGCEICGVVDASGLIDSGAATLRLKLDALAKGPSSFKLATDPPEAIVTIDGEIVGTTPLNRPIVPGKHIIRISKEGFIALEREITFVDGVGEELAYTLEKLPSRLPGKRWGYASIAVGILGIGGGIALTALDGRNYSLDCAGMNVMNPGITGEKECKYLFDTKWYGVAATLAGAALLTLGTVILVNSRPKTDRDKKRAGLDRRGVQQLGLGPGSVILRGQF